MRVLYAYSLQVVINNPGVTYHYRFYNVSATTLGVVRLGDENRIIDKIITLIFEYSLPITTYKNHY